MIEYSGTSAPRGMEIPQAAADLIEQQQARISELEQREGELVAHVERLRDALQNYTAEQVCCGQGEIQYSSEGEPIGQECCGRPDIDWPEDVTALLASTSRQNLNAVKLNALLDFRHDCGSMNGYNAVDVWDKMDEYIKREFG